ncbi:hypothetical protein QYF61_018476 [Mycteria americana]|uniref:Uncharacterized protein n=1 Tax=Mycteria americana TaxID=33587 RepID=A0AAN7MIK1_MYCAM|nr:hypothetical protein QYF61_018476 [Mycteria americana]
MPSQFPRSDRYPLANSPSLYTGHDIIWDASQGYSSRLRDSLPQQILESHRLEKTFKIIESNRKPNTAKTTTIPCP